MAIWSRLTAFVTGGAVATAAADAMAPEFEVLKQTAWRNEPHKVLDPRAAAELYLKQIPTGVDEQDDAARGGVGSSRFSALVQMLAEYPGASELLTLWRRQIITQDEFTRALRRQKVPDDWIGHLSNLKQDVLDAGELAAAIHRGLIPDPGLLKGEQPEPPFTVEAYPVYDISALTEAEAHGYDKDHLGVLVGLQGLPMGVIEAAQARFRGIITKGDYIRAFNESNNRNEWAEAVFEYARQIPTARDFMENALRGHHDFNWAAEQAARHGMSRDDAFIIYQNQGRPLNLHQISQAIAWGAKYNPGAGDNPDPWMQAVLLGAVRPEYYEMQDTLKYNLPSAFFFRVLQQSNVLTADEADVWYRRMGWPPDLARKVADAFAATSPSTKQTHTDKARTQLWTRTHTSYLAAEIDEAEARQRLPQAGVPAGEVDAIIQIWNDERDVERKQLTPTQVKKAWKGAVTNPATGAPWTRDEALAALIGRGYPPNDANTFLEL